MEAGTLGSESSSNKHSLLDVALPEPQQRRLLALLCLFQLFLHAKPSEPHLVRPAVRARPQPCDMRRADAALRCRT